MAIGVGVPLPDTSAAVPPGSKGYKVAKSRKEALVPRDTPSKLSLRSGLTVLYVRT